MNEEQDKKSIYKKWWFWVGSIVVLFILISTLGGGNESSTNQATDPQQESNEREQVASRCLGVPAETLSWIKSGLKDDNITLRSAQAVRSDDFEKVYFVSADLQGLGLEGPGDIATFAANNIDGSGLVLSVDAVAKEFTDWFHGDREGAQFHVTMRDDGVRESRDCVSQ
ncbi:MAG: hypothetical protein WDZ80_04440 [Candidatus Paceibacterota bacterium]